MQRETEAVGGRFHNALSLRALLFAAILIAGAPGVIFGALQAAHTYNAASQSERVVRGEDAVRASVRFDATLRAAADRVAAIAVSDTVKKGGASCNAALATSVTTQSLYSFIGRTDARGRITCGSNSSLMGTNLAGDQWFGAAKAAPKEPVTGLTRHPDGEANLIVAHAIGTSSAFEGVGFVVIPRRWFADALAEDMGALPGAVAIFNSQGDLVAAAARGFPAGDAVAKARTALKSKDGIASDGYLSNVVTTGVPGYRFVSVAPQSRQAEITLRAALIVLSPVLVSALSIVAIWLALDRWLLRWFFRLRDAAEDFARGRYAPPPMEGAPAEISSLAAAFEAAVSQSRTRERDLEGALKSNMTLTRELHHRVKNNLQVLSSLISRQQRRTEEPVVRSALGEARARMAPVALAYRFINPPEDLVSIDMEAYLRELTRQLHVSLNGEARGVKLEVNADSDPMAVDDATNLGLIVAEAFVSGYSHAAGMSGATASLSSTRNADGGHKISVGVLGATDQSNSQRGLDRELVQELARQLRAEAGFDASGIIHLTVPPPSETRH